MTATILAIVLLLLLAVIVTAQFAEQRAFRAANRPAQITFDVIAWSAGVLLVATAAALIVEVLSW